AVIKEKPRYIARVNKDGSFTFRNLPSGTFSLYALKDEGSQRKYMAKSQLFGFLNHRVTPAISPLPDTLYAYTEKEEKEKDKNNAPKPGANPAATARPSGPPANAKPAGAKKNEQQDKRLKIESNLSNKEQDLLTQLELRFATPLKSFDSTKITFTNDQFQPITNYQLITDTSKKKITLSYNWTENTAYNLILDKDFAEDTLGHKLTRTD